MLQARAWPIHESSCGKTRWTTEKQLLARDKAHIPPCLAFTVVVIDWPLAYITWKMHGTVRGLQTSDNLDIEKCNLRVVVTC